MTVRPELMLFRGGGDLATGAVWRLWRARFPIVVCELAQPLTVRRTVSVSSAVTQGSVAVEGMPAQLAQSATHALELAGRGIVAVLVSPHIPAIPHDVLVDARLAKRNIDTTIGDAPLVLALGPGFEAGVDAHAVIETMRGPRLGRVLWSGTAEPNTGVPGEVGGKGAERVVRAPATGVVSWLVDIGDRVAVAQEMGRIGGCTVAAPFEGVVRGLIAEGTEVPVGLKIADVDPRVGVDCHEISDKALAVGGGVLEAVLTWTSAAS
ncbi:MAG TPA: selenium-dependent molybdenum cofactor biosynthesis protein YqeB [Ilumatobacteraceae bacterium]|nr:selenium-dependent molybdenum cofactor biosynthesis protein YqeB [Ilumatobacteraceae bacterium]HRB01821.1 selenium-dependent molybdenum cofactor biosynthesis protein YqeB [Ilumatobacteraceae bacterium]